MHQPASLRLHTWCLQTTQSQLCFSVFLRSGRGSPAILFRVSSRLAGLRRRLLILAGDVEVNPGPAHVSVERCDYCKGKISDTQMQSAITCSARNCNVKCHHSHCGIGRYRPLTEFNKWKCNLHSPAPRHKPVKPPQLKQRCAVCPSLVNTPIICGKCNKHYHKQLKCSGIDSREARDKYANDSGSWTCERCANIPASLSENNPIKDHAVDNSSSATVDKDHLRIMSWNANALSSIKMTELPDRLNKEDIDICLIQESMLKPGTKTPRVQHYATLRADRTVIRGGGLIVFIRDSIQFEDQGANKKDGTEVYSFRVKLGKNKWIQISNVYCPPSNTIGHDCEVKLHLDLIPTGSQTIVMGDFNAHSHAWDFAQPEDARGEQLEQWLIESDLSVMNDGTSTRLNKGTGGMSAPDVSMCGKSLTGKFEWKVSEAIGSSDHLPIVTTLWENIGHRPVLGTRTRWRSNQVDWKKFSDAVEVEMSATLEEPDLKARSDRFAKILKDAATLHVGRTKPGKKTRSYLTPAVKAKIKKRNKLRRTITRNRTEWKEACQDVNDSIKDATEQKWIELLADVVTDADDAKLWKIVRSLNGSPETNSPNQAMIHNKKVITSDKKKADVFMSHYAKVSKLTFTKAERAWRRKFKRRWNALPREEPSAFFKITLTDLDRALAKTKTKGAAGPDDIPPSFLKALGPLAKSELLAIMNQSLLEGWCPQEWRNAIIVPLLKRGKSASELASYRPISLTSCIAKLMERTIADKIYYLAEEGNWLSPLQAGFRKGRSTEDQIARVVQAISDGLHSPKMERSVLVLLDYSKAYDTVWRERLLNRMLDLGVPIPLVRWISAFLSNRQARVRYNNTLGKTQVLQQGVPQGSVLSPLLFLLYIDELAHRLPSDTVNSLFADDVGAVATHRDRLAAQQQAQKTVDIIAKWSVERKLSLNADKCEVCYFTNATSTQETSWIPLIKIDGKPIPPKRNPRLLGVYLDRQLTFNFQVETVAKSARSASRILAALSNTDWGWKSDCLRKIFFSHVRSKYDYAGPAWQAQLSDSGVQVLERTQNRALRYITGQYKATRVETLRKQAGVTSVKTNILRNTVKAYEKALRCPPDHPRYLAATGTVAKRLVRQSWRTLAEGTLTSLNLTPILTPRAPLDLFHTAPWEDGPVTVSPHVEGIRSRHDDIEVKKRASEECIRKYNASTIIYTDGSASEGTKDGGAAAVVTTGDPAAPEVLHTVMKRGSRITCSYGEEHTAMQLALDWVSDNCQVDDNVLICTDSQSLCLALCAHVSKIAHIRARLQTIVARTCVQWIPGHSDVVGNELADAAAKRATTLDEPPGPVTFRSACAFIDSKIKDDPLPHPRSREIYAKFSRQKDQEAVKCRADEALLGQIRSGEHVGFKVFQQRIGECDDTKCEDCGSEVHDVEHWFVHCPAHSEMRQRLFGDYRVELEYLSSEPKLVLAFARSTLLGARE